MKKLFFVSFILYTTAVCADWSMTLIEERFKNADKNSDNQITLAEAENGMPRVATHFDLIDQDKNGFVTLDEIKQVIAEIKLK